MSQGLGLTRASFVHAFAQTLRPSTTWILNAVTFVSSTSILNFRNMGSHGTEEQRCGSLQKLDSNTPACVTFCDKADPTIPKYGSVIQNPYPPMIAPLRKMYKQGPHFTPFEDGEESPSNLLGSSRANPTLANPILQAAPARQGFQNMSNPQETTG